MKKNVLIFAGFLICLSAFAVEFPSKYQPEKAKICAKNNTWTLSNKLFSAKYTLKNGTLIFDGAKAFGLAGNADLFNIKLNDGTEVNSSQMQLLSVEIENLAGNAAATKIAECYDGKALRAEFLYKNLTFVWRAVLRNNSHYLRTELEVSATADTDFKEIVAMIYDLNPEQNAPKVVGNTRGSLLANEQIFAALETPMGINEIAENASQIQGRWVRNATLKSGETWRVSAVVGLIAEGQARRSFLAYHERERAVPWRSFIHYNSWYELNIDRNNAIDRRMSKDDCLQVVEAWEKNLFEPYNTRIDAFVWDDGWDDFNSLWDFYRPKFPNGFAEIDALCRKHNIGTGAWLGPVGGYGASKEQRLAFWNANHEPDIYNFQLSNEEYFEAFVGRCSQMIADYDMRYFKFDGISDIPNAVGPGNVEDAEGFLRLTQALRAVRKDLFLNCTVGTWASPFWFRYADAVWRQDADWNTIGDQGNARQRWITYRDYMVYKNFVAGSPLCPINSLMTHGLIVSGFGKSDKNPPRAMEDDSTANTASEIVKEMRCAFACGSGLVELYIDHELMSAKNNGELWRELATCIEWHRANADVLADTHWVGGNPWDGMRANVYGWAAWNAEKSTLALRNPCSTPQTFTTTLREALDIPAHIKGRVHLSDAFSGQTQYANITNSTIDIDEKITFAMPAFDVVVFNGTTKSN